MNLPHRTWSIGKFHDYAEEERIATILIRIDAPIIATNDGLRAIDSSSSGVQAQNSLFEKTDGAGRVNVEEGNGAKIAERGMVPNRALPITLVWTKGC